MQPDYIISGIWARGRFVSLHAERVHAAHSFGQSGYLHANIGLARRREVEAREGLDDMMDAFRHLGIEKKNLSRYKAMGEAGNGAIYEPYSTSRRKGRFCLLRVSAISKKPRGEMTWGTNVHHLDEYTNARRALRLYTQDRTTGVARVVRETVTVNGVIPRPTRVHGHAYACTSDSPMMTCLSSSHIHVVVLNLLATAKVNHDAQVAVPKRWPGVADERTSK